MPILAPVLLFQGRRLKKCMPRLPEANGPRSGKLGTGTTLKLLIIGDSAAAGVGVATQQEALSGQLSAQLSRTFMVDWHLLAKSGVDVGGCIAYHQKQPCDKYDVILVSIGVNDVIGRAPGVTWQHRLKQLITLLTQQYQPQHIVFTNVPPMEQFRALVHPMRWYLGAKALHFNQILKHTVAQETQCSLLTIDGNISCDDMASDGFHPGAKIYQQWAKQASDHITHLIKDNADKTA